MAESSPCTPSGYTGPVVLRNTCVERALTCFAVEGCDGTPITGEDLGNALDDIQDALASGCPGGGSAGQVLTKSSANDYDYDWVTPSSGVTDHGALTGLGDDDHTQYYNNTRLTAWLASLTTDNLAEGTNNLYNRIPVGGTAGQVLSKIDGADYNAQWTTPGVVGTGIYGGSGTVPTTTVATLTDTLQFSFNTSTLILGQGTAPELELIYNSVDSSSDTNAYFYTDLTPTFFHFGQMKNVRSIISVDSSTVNIDEMLSLDAISQITSNVSANEIIAIEGRNIITSGNTVNESITINSILAVNNSSTITDAKLVSSEVIISNAGDIITNLYGFTTRIGNNNGTIINTYGVHVGDITDGTQTNTPYSFYASDNDARNYFAGLMQLPKYGQGNYSGGISYLLGVDGAGNIREQSSTSASIYGGSGVIPSSVTAGITDTLRFGSDLLRLDGTTNRVGIGTASPLKNFEVAGNTGVTMRMTNTDNTLVAFDRIGTFEFYSSDTDDPGVAAEIVAKIGGTSSETSLGFRVGTPSLLGESLTLETNWQVRLGLYGVGTYVGTAAKWLAVDSSGYIIEENAPTGVTDHGALTGLLDDDHTQYHNDLRADTWLTTKDSDDLTEGSTNLYNKIPIGGTANQVLAKIDATNYNTQWVDNFGGIYSGSGSLIVNTVVTQAGYSVSFTGTNNSVIIPDNGDPQIQFDPLGGGTIWSVGVDNDDGDSFKIHTGAIGTDPKFVIASDGRTGIGTGIFSPSSKLTVKGDTATDGSPVLFFDSTVEPTISGVGLYNFANISGNNASAINIGLHNRLNNNNLAGANIYATPFLSSIYNYQNVTDLRQYSTELLNNTGNTITEWFGYYVAPIVNQGTITNTYGVYVDDIVYGTQTNTPWSFYAANSNANNYLSGQLQLPDYGGGSYAGTATKWLAVDTDGWVIEENAPTDDTGLYVGSGTVPTGVVATLTDTIEFNGGDFGIGVSPAYRLHVAETQTETSGFPAVGYFRNTVAPTGASSASNYGIRNYIDINSANNVFTLGGFNTNITLDAAHTGDVTFTSGLSNNITLNSATSSFTTVYGNTTSILTKGTVSSLYGDVITLNNSSGGTITNAYLSRVNLSNSASTITNTYGYYVGDITAGTQTNTPYSFYASDSNAVNYLSGQLQLPDYGGASYAGTATKWLAVDTNGWVIEEDVPSDITDHTLLTNIGVNTHAQIDSHIADTANPHGTSDANLVVTDVTTNNTTTLAHGFAPKLSGTAGQYLDGNGNWTTPSGVANAYVSQAFAATTTVNVVHNFAAYPIVQVLVSTDVFVPYSITHNSVNDFTVTFSNNQTGTVLATVGSPQENNYVSAAGNYTVLSDDYIVESTGSGSTITLPTAVGIESHKFLIKNTSPGNITIDTTSSQTMDGDLTIILTPNEALEVVSNGVNFLVI